MQSALDSFGRRLKYVRQFSSFRVPNLSAGDWTVFYYNDDGSPVLRANGRPREHVGRYREGTLYPVTAAHWADIQALDIDWNPATWQELQLDALINGQTPAPA
jgi:hypothetical protein